MSERIDARGLSCPQPVVLTKNMIDKLGQGSFEVVVDTATSRDNIERMAASWGWKVTVTEEKDEFILRIVK